MEINAADLPIQQPANVMNEDGSINVCDGVECAEDMPKKDYLDELKFMEEKVDILVHDSTDQNADNPVSVGVNGNFVFIDRGVVTTLKRKFVDALIVKLTRVSTPEYINGAHERAFKINQVSALKYPFSIVRDPSPVKGGAWLRRRIAETV